jgi:hypothetical protein
VHWPKATLQNVQYSSNYVQHCLMFNFHLSKLQLISWIRIRWCLRIIKFQSHHGIGELIGELCKCLSYIIINFLCCSDILVRITFSYGIIYASFQQWLLDLKLYGTPQTTIPNKTSQVSISILICSRTPPLFNFFVATSEMMRLQFLSSH